MLEFMRIHAIKKDLLSKRECIYEQKLALMTYRTSLSEFFETKSVDEIKLNENQILKYVYEMEQAIESLENIEQDVQFELDLLKSMNTDHMRSLERVFKEDEKCAESESESKLTVNLDSQEFFDRVKSSYSFKSRYKAFFETFLMKKENQLLIKLNQELRTQLKET